MSANLLIGITALGAGWVLLHSKRADMAVDAAKAATDGPTVANDPKDTTTKAADSLIVASETQKGMGFAAADVGDTDPSTSPVVNSHLAGLGVSPVKPRPESPSQPSCGSSDCEFGGGSGPGSMTAPAPTPETAPAPATSVASFSTVTPSTIINAMVYGENQKVTAKEESAAMETYGPQGGYIW